ncbi:50S ribosomal protein L35ae [Candidatus Woesearchaeota archaeon]|nr:50S ribosomal protein L35ae [Candidatus Woesearchaeota archaeon]
MDGMIKNFRRGRHRVKMNQMVVYPAQMKGREEAKGMVGKTVTWKSPGGKELKGTIRSAHGGKGAVRVLFETGMPGQAIGEKVNIHE